MSADVDGLETRIGYTFKQKHWIQHALRHPSFAPGAFGRLEFLGDAALGLAVAESAYQRFTHLSEGDLTRLRARYVQKKTLATLAKAIRLDKLLLIGPALKGKKSTESMLADAFEAVCGAVFLDGGYAAVQNVIWRVLDAYVEKNQIETVEKDSKTRLQEWCQAHAKPLPIYTYVAEVAHEPYKCVRGSVQGIQGVFEAKDTSKKGAEQQVAALILHRIQSKGDNND